MPVQGDKELLHVILSRAAAIWRQQSGTCKKVQLLRFNCEVKAEKTRLVIYELWKFFQRSFYEEFYKECWFLLGKVCKDVELLNLFSWKSLLRKFTVLKESIEIIPQIAVKRCRWQNYSLHEMLFSERCFLKILIKQNKSFPLCAARFENLCIFIQVSLRKFKFPLNVFKFMK